MTTLQDIKKDLPDWPDDVIDQWLLKFANQEGMSWPPPDPLIGRWKLLITHPLSWWKDVTWTKEKRDCGFDNLSIGGRKTMNSMYKALILGEDNGFGGDDSKARFARQLGILLKTGEFERPPVLFPIASGLSPLDGNHRIYAHVYAMSVSDEELAANNFARPAASQTVWIASHKDGEDPG